MNVGCETDLRAVRDGLIGGSFAMAWLLFAFGVVGRPSCLLPLTSCASRLSPHCFDNRVHIGPHHADIRIRAAARGPHRV